MNVRRTNPSTAGMGCAHCGGEGDCFDSPAYGYAAAQSSRDQPGIDYTAMGLPTQTQVLAVNTNGAVAPLTNPSGIAPDLSSGYPMGINAGSPTAGANPSGWFASLFGPGNAVTKPGTAANALAQTSPDYPSPMALTVAQAFSNDYGDAQPGFVPLPKLNWTANNLSFVKRASITPQCVAVGAMNAHPLLLIGGAFALFYLLNQKKGRAA